MDTDSEGADDDVEVNVDVMTVNDSDCGVDSDATEDYTVQTAQTYTAQSVQTVSLSPGQENQSPNPVIPTTPIRDIWFFVPPKKKWLRQEVSVTEVTCNKVTVTFLESGSRDGFFKDVNCTHASEPARTVTDTA